MFEILISLLLIYNLFIYNPIRNLIIFLSIILLLGIKLFILEYYFITWIFIIIYASALLILFTYALMIKYECINYNTINYLKLKEYQISTKVLVFILFFIFIILLIYSPISSISSISNIYILNEINYKSLFIMKYLLYIEPFYVIFLFIQLWIAFLILIR